MSYSEFMSDRLIKFLRLFGLALFYLVQWSIRPARPIRIIFNLIRGKQESKSEQGIANILRNKKIISTHEDEYQPLAEYKR